jgi:glycosyltransferase involved in cell wall biosynthesis
VRTRRLQADVVHVHESGWIAGFAHWVAEKLRVPVVCKEACGVVLRWPERKDIPWLSRWEKRRSQCAFIAITPHIRDELERAGIPSHRIFDVPNGVELPEVVACPGASHLAVYGGNFSQGADFKGFDVLLKAWAVAQRAAPEMRLQLFGAGDSAVWRRMAAEEGVGESVEFAGSVPNLTPIFAQAGFLVLPSRVEGLSNVLLEAQAVGLPAVVSDIPGNRSVVTDDENGLVVPVGDIAALAKAMLRMHRSRDLRAKLGRAARETIARRFSIAGVAEQLELVYRKLQTAGKLLR